MELNGIEVKEIDVLDLDVREKVEKIRNEYMNKFADSKRYKGTDIEKGKAMCDDVSDFVDKVFGDGVSKKVFQGRHNLRIAMEVFEAAIDYLNNQDKDFDDYSNKMRLKYTPLRTPLTCFVIMFYSIV